MPNLNSVHLMGNLTRDPEVRYTPKGTAVCDLSLAINRLLPPEQEGGERREEVTYVDVTLWGKSAENAGQHLAKGRSVFIDGRLALETWDDRQTGQKRSKLKVVAESWQFLGPKPAQGATAEPKPETKPANHKRPASAGKKSNPERDPDLDAEPEDVPFHSTIYRDVRRSKLNRRVF
jgi:single-strand DNA-binding protein